MKLVKKEICGRQVEDFSRHPHFRKGEYFSFWPYYDTTLQVFTLGIEERQTNVFVKHECTPKPTFRKNK